MDLPTPSENLLILSKFPAVQILSIHGKGLLVIDGSCLQPQVPVDFHLREYTGSYQTLPYFLPSTTLTRLPTSSGPCSPLSFITQMQGIQGPNNLTALDATFNASNITTFTTLVGLFPQLTELRIRIVFPSEGHMFKDELWDVSRFKKERMAVDGTFGDSLRVGFEPSFFFAALANSPTLPPALERLSLSWTCNDEYMNQLSAYKLPDFARLRDTLLAGCPTLTCLWLDGYYFLFQWRNVPSEGTVKEDTAVNFLHAYGKRQDSEIFWEGEEY
ncbi:hypothetical protein B0H17DRAFT_1195257 [Mycena rosella]|uniref:Uncharacterized protein n=1 Tax=Mycena rosella TaxID=1033263 RepID=A0AAD7DXW6_MYCRO|nr:hypothetical protein B0H17DRAFT_1195257 [Mycena rosella]